MSGMIIQISTKIIIIVSSVFASVVLETSINEIFDRNEKGASIYGNSLNILIEVVFISAKPNKMHSDSFVILFYGIDQPLFLN